MIAIKTRHFEQNDKSVNSNFIASHDHDKKKQQKSSYFHIYILTVPEVEKNSDLIHKIFNKISNPNSPRLCSRPSGLACEREVVINILTQSHLVIIVINIHTF